MSQSKYKYDKVFFVSDLHIGHHKIIGYDDRPYTSDDEMWEDIKTKWNAKVGEDDTVFILGDFIWKCSKSKCKDICSQLNGKKVLILGNHDREKDIDETCFERIARLETIKVSYPDFDSEEEKEMDITLCHFPMLAWNMSFSANNIQLFGHMHNTLKLDDIRWNQMDVGWDVKYDLFSFSDIIETCTKQLLLKKQL